LIVFLTKFTEQSKNNVVGGREEIEQNRKNITINTSSTNNNHRLPCKADQQEGECRRNLGSECGTDLKLPYTICDPKLSLFSFIYETVSF
jgi:hypothetical protein